MLEIIACTIVGLMIEGLFILGLILILWGIFNLNSKREDKIKKIISLTLEQFCRINDIPIVNEGDYNNDDPEKAAAGYISYEYCIATGAIKNATIHIRKDLGKLLKDCYWSLLAHEIGHYISQNVYYDNTELGADFEAYRLISAIIPNSHMRIMKFTMKIYFETNYTHPMNLDEQVVKSYHEEYSKLQDQIHVLRGYYEDLWNYYYRRHGTME